MPFRRSLRTRILVSFVSLIGITIFLLSTLSFITARSLLTQRIFSELSNRATAQENFLEEVLRTDKQRTALLTSRPEVRTHSIDALFQELRLEQINVLGISVFDTNGLERAAAGMASDAPSKTPSATILLPHIDRFGRWIGHDVYSPIRAQDGTMLGTLALRYDATALLQNFFTATATNDESEVVIGWLSGEQLYGFVRSSNKEIFIEDLGNVSFQSDHAFPLAKAVQGGEGTERAWNRQGRDALVAYRSLPSIGWGLVIEVPAHTAFAGVRQLAIRLFGLGGGLLGAAFILGISLSSSLSSSLRQLAKQVSTLGPGRWSFRRSITTGDEVEMLDTVVANLSSRLQKTYAHLEEEVGSRTKELKKQYAIDRAILENIESGVVTVDQKGLIVDLNPTALRLMDLEKSKTVGRLAEDMLNFRYHKGLPADEHPVAVCLRKKTVFRSDPTRHLSVVRKDNRGLPIILLVSPLFTGKTFTGAIAVFQDMTEERQIDYMKSEFISLASHQLRTPLSALRWYVELLTTDAVSHLSPTQKKYVAEINQSSKRMANLLDALLRVAKLEGTALTPEKQSIELTKFLRETVAELKVQAKESGLTCSVSLPKKSISLKTDATLLRIVLQNLFSNAVKYSSTGGEVSFSLHAHKQTVEIFVKDHGVGIPQNEWSRVFEKFFRAKNVRQMDTDGSGLGLYLSKTIIENLGGKITFKSIEGKGTEFVVKLPRR